jgi:hypothetical protein
MIYIAHRGLFQGPDKEKENHPDQIRKALKKRYDCEVDVWWKSDGWWLGHDEPQYKVDSSFIGQQGLWLHCKNLDALYELSTAPFKYTYFWHQEDDFTLTSSQHIWTYPGKDLTNNSIAVMPERDDEYWDYVKNLDIFGVCTDYVEKFITETRTMPVGSTEKLR